MAATTAVFTEPLTMLALLGSAGVVGIGHTLLGPDHYLPIVAVAKSERWSARRALAFTALAGLLHCAASLLVVAVVLALADADAGAGWLALQQVRGTATGWAMVGAGLLLAGIAWRRGRALPAGGPVLLALFALGPCEWLLPNALLAADGGILAVGAVGGVFTLATVATMTACVAVGLRAVPRLRPDGPWARLLPGAAMACCGALMLLGL